MGRKGPTWMHVLIALKKKIHNAMNQRVREQ